MSDQPDTPPSDIWYCLHSDEEVIVEQITDDMPGMCCCGSPIEMCQTPHTHVPYNPQLNPQQKATPTS